MRSYTIRTVASASALALFIAACHDSTAPSGTPASVRIVSGNAQTGAAGQKLAISPTFIVEDAHGVAVSNARVGVTVAAASGTISDAPGRSSAGATSVGTWTLGPRVGVDTLKIEVEGLAPVFITANATAGPAASIVSSTSTTFSARVGESPSVAPHVRLTDAFGNPVASASIRLALTGGGSVSSTVTTDANGAADISDWSFATHVGQNVLTLTAGNATLSFIANLAAGEPAQIVPVDGDGQSAPAGSALGAVHARVADKYGNGIGAQSVSFAVTNGGGSLSSQTGTSAADGLVTLPEWTLGKLALPQIVRVTSGSLTLDLNATVATDYHIDVRFFGPDMTDDQRALFTNAAARISAIVTGHLPDMILTNFNIANACGLYGLPIVTEAVHDLVIYASVQDIDGAGRILAESGPCVTRARADGGLTSVGLMLFDVADLASMAQRGILQDVITHEMLHVVGIGTLWSDKNLIAAAGTPSVAYYGSKGRQGCADNGGIAICANAVPVENNGVLGTADAHWRETAFGNELMTGYVNFNGMPLSAMTIGSLADLGYVVNPLAADSYRVPTGGSANVIPTTPTVWERHIRPVSPDSGFKSP